MMILSATSNKTTKITVIGHAILDPPQLQEQDLMETIQMAVSMSSKPTNNDPMIIKNVFQQYFLKNTKITATTNAYKITVH